MELAKGITNARELKRLFRMCPVCGSSPGNDLDLIITAKSFLRKCNCGWSVEMFEYKEPKPKNLPTAGTCIARDCLSPIKSRRLCERHYAQKRRGKLVELKFY